MPKPSSKKANDFIAMDSRELSTVFAKIRLLEDLTRKITPYLDENVRSYCHIANIMSGRLVLIAANGSIATQLRFQTPELLKKFKTDPSLRHIVDIHCKVRPSHNPAPAKKNSQMAPLTQATAEIVKGMAESIEDPKLREIMERIAGRVRGK